MITPTDLYRKPVYTDLTSFDTLIAFIIAIVFTIVFDVTSILISYNRIKPLKTYCTFTVATISLIMTPSHLPNEALPIL